jgi:hypothetical protein
MRIAFIARFNKIYDEEGKALSLEKLGHEVFRFDEDSFNTTELYNNVRSVIATAPDVVIYAKLEVPGRMELVRELKSRGIKTVTWFPDYCNAGTWQNTAFNMRDLENCPLANSDYVFLPDNTNKDRWNSLGINQHCVRQGIYDGMCYRGVKDDNYNKDILFVGSVNYDFYRYRVPLIEFLQKEYGDRFLHVGGADCNELRNDELSNAVASVKIVIGDSVYAPEYWSNRIYETIGRGGMCIHSYTEGIDDEYEVGKHFDVYTGGNYQELKSKIDYYLANDVLRESISAQGMEFTKANHTLLNRAEQVVNIISKEIFNEN